MEIYTVQQGDTLWRIANRLNADLAQLLAANGLGGSSPLVPGQALVIPDRFFQYIVQEGDQLGTIAARLGVTARSLIEANVLRNPASLSPGQVLYIPYRNHTVRAGETLYGIARAYGVNPQSITRANQLTSASLAVSQVLRIPAPARPVKEVNAYTTSFDVAGAGEVYRLGHYFTYLSPFRHAFREDGSLTPLNDRPVIQAAEANGVQPLLILANFTERGFSSDLAARLLRNEPLQGTLINNLLTAMRQKGYRGVNFDFEYVYPEDRDRYTAFLQRAVRRLRPEGFLVSTALAPKNSGTQQGLLYEAHDYGAHGAIVDFIILMTYEWGWAGGRPWAIAPINEVRHVLDYAVTVIPPNKIMMGAPLYGRDWKIPWHQGTFARTISPQEAVALAAQYGAEIRYHPTYQSPYFRYTDETGQQHEVWFEDARSIRAKINLLNEYGLRGISYWVLGNPFPQNWVVQQALVQARKR
ncbi:LysM peptidoglycan-binding domain-containing protein [Weizmannia acidilactici]|uniref:LysM peptidoglycan-binding domain-containing protein n=1 Tax=Weizmannia acidilactici TaxID=2607726 RepID=UPI00124E9A1C|nr:LysM peptidoglycan-binding domain-containing protein [Weizmannia acidilactici]GER66100.1 germination protein [Weizmannia acidilactici]GER72409.1 germination protein [Weizmannia acidilactici]